MKAPATWPARPQRPTPMSSHDAKLGFKNPKWLTAIEVTNNYPGGYWEDRGYNWFSGM